MSKIRENLLPILMVCAIVCGSLLGAFWPGASMLEPLGTIFINLMFCMVVPLVFSSVAGAIGTMGSAQRAGKIMATAVAVFVITGLIAAAIERYRETKPIETTLELVDIIKGAMPGKALKEKQHPAKRSFQAIRIAVNDELTAVDRMIRAAVPRLNPGGRLAVITFHSLEDRIVKTGMAEFAKGCTCPSDFPVCVCGKTPDLRLVNKKPILPSEQELTENPRSRSAKLRVAEKTR